MESNFLSSGHSFFNSSKDLPIFMTSISSIGISNLKTSLSVRITDSKSVTLVSPGSSKKKKKL